MNIFDLFVDAFKAKVILKANQGAKARAIEFDAIADDIEMMHGAIPDIGKVRAHLIVCLSSKPNWGCRKVIREFDSVVAKVKANG
ncbi:hypothetical protein [Moritella viscosa]|uniref:Uncharacterized protein n=1 Tax=Moritella viscosa TaxID=80854 RepID=A0A1L0AQ70_9GAMM|nr:hypothetical protein [Moritella viscosa]SGZ20367.1 Putative uncharacterized protein [Moritella viscosa]SHO06033.1 Putative uncharacterized protein [Moritella viscosa]SHO15468.1 Putative uncharacterized protein [Moritella viscosa]SHO15849.1 Putative uncharacterized protein [Moritella viscosa]SHO19085.1 Putative uncharacterized protein [Moritella viscosa]